MFVTFLKKKKDNAFVGIVIEESFNVIKRKT